jgi:hypothetical protein
MFMTADSCWRMAQIIAAHSRDKPPTIRRRMRRAARLFANLAMFQWTNPNDPRTLEPPWPKERVIGLMTKRRASRPPH